MQNVVKIFILLTFIASVAVAQESRIKTSIDFVGMSMDYREYSKNTGALLDSEESDFTDLGGIDLGISFLLSQGNSSATTLEANIMRLGGNTVYKGSILGSGNPYGSLVSSTANTITDTRFFLTKYRYLDNFSMNYAVGIGYRNWERALSSSQIEIYEWYSLRGRVIANYNFTKKLNIGLKTEYQFGFKETMSASNLGSTFDLGGADIWNIGCPIVYSYSDKMDITFEATYQVQKIIESNVINGYYEPRSTSKNQYLQIGLNFKY